MFEYWNPTRTRGQGYYFLNLTEEELRDRIVAPWDRGDPVTWDGRTAESSKSMIEVYRTADPIDRGDVQYENELHRLMSAGENVTNDWIMAAAGNRVGASSGAGLQPGQESPLRDHARVMVVHGRNGRARDAMFTFLRALGLVVILEAGLAMGVDRGRTILVEVGPIRRASDFDGLNVVRLTNAAPSRNALRSRLVTAGCAVDEGASDWMRPESGGDFDAAVIEWSPADVGSSPTA
jgi:hypothetical protein